MNFFFYDFYTIDRADFNADLTENAASTVDNIISSVRKDSVLGTKQLAIVTGDASLRDF